MPVLVLQHRETPYDGVAHRASRSRTRYRTPTVRFLDGNYASNPSGERGPIAEFLGAPALDPSAARTITILFTDIVDSTATDPASRRRTRAGAGAPPQQQSCAMPLSANFGTEVKHTGDGIMASFLSAPRALDAAVQIQRSRRCVQRDRPNVPWSCVLA